ncbi:MAG: 50S ribosomal protein L1, large subunit ribosomal protein L1 [candidate division WS6 bacterium GW2011_GWC1_33_20]|uniref:Ribosomal protein n=2 Tax=Candidatus Dojkabacteria TaxID=74243 RepID=A0A0G0AE32_9BACT|nr:MAG: 50S ribosomal protein L1, large subunit ribosomal protein L1 [candidate division WS6 bacterium GW2011_GWE2_33_157]KKP44441.1 MAG: 50S ribosomal protein L1, large subunit ribosomal protein L1 [candidate division WS6 bacterium GW2011_GWF1_33_233]KKP44731.1 MAG: 50S ribosomal protein L1, large subunit ribosomal protein L1 [candidate division WS6 bacterium GW2011_GWC1_33_20]KKP53981.1 MAG: 50S ribosomal protein L1, large subunit ribosomal protein L1 [candidate division WS6 bacterium GW2011_W
MKRGKKYIKVTKNLDRNKSYSLSEAIKEVKKTSYSKFVGSLEVHFDINIPKDKDPKSIKGAVSLPHSTDVKSVKIAVFATPDKEKDAKEAGADYVGLEKLIEDIKENKIQFDVAIATPSVMAKIAVLGKELGPKGLMPNPKNGTVTDDIKSAVSEYKKGKQTFACDTSGVIHMKAGKLDMDDDKLIENIHTAVSAVEDVLGKVYNQAINRMHVVSTMGPSFKVTYVKPE